jgi:hypothetical protein
MIAVHANGASWHGIVEELWDEAFEAVADDLVESRQAILASDVRSWFREPKLYRLSLWTV